jgi:hypothetical protein
VTDDPSAYTDPYTALKERLLAAYGRSKWEKLDSLLNFPKMGVNERPSVVLARLNTLKPASLEELYIAIHLPPGAAGRVPQAFLAVPIQDCRGAGGRCGRPLGDEGRQPGHRGGCGPLCLPWATAVAILPAAAATWGRRRWWQQPTRRWLPQPQQWLPRGLCRDCSPTPGGTPQNDGSGSNGGGGGGGRGIHDGAHVGTGICFHHYTYGRSATRCKPPCLFAQGNGAAAAGS